MSEEVDFTAVGSAELLKSILGQAFHPYRGVRLNGHVMIAVVV